MAREFIFGHDEIGGWRQVRGPLYLNLSAIISTLGLLDVDQRLGFIGHQPGEYPDWRIFAKPPGCREIRGLLFEDSEYARHDYDPYRAVSEVLGLEFAGDAIQGGVPRHRTVKSPVPVNDPNYLLFAYGLFCGGDKLARKKTYWSVLPSTGGANWSPLSWFVSRSEGAVSVAELKTLFPPIPEPHATAESPSRPTDARDPLQALATTGELIEKTVQTATADLALRVDDVVGRLADLEEQHSLDQHRLGRMEETANTHSAEVARQLAELRETIKRLNLKPDPPPSEHNQVECIGASVRAPPSQPNVPSRDPIAPTGPMRGENCDD
jgi:hypothetical protein